MQAGASSQSAASLQPGYVLHARDYRDTSLLVELLTPEGGRVSAVARGARSQRRGSSQRAVLQPFQPLWVELSGQSELKTLRQSETRLPPLQLRGQALFSGLYVNELLCRLLHRDDPHPELFADYETVLQRLAQDSLVDVALRHFELRLLEELGYGYSLDIDADTGGDIDPEAHYLFDVQRGLVRHGGGASEMSLSGRALLDFVVGEYSAEARRALKRICRAALRPHLGDKPLRSRALFPRER